MRHLGRTRFHDVCNHSLFSTWRTDPVTACPVHTCPMIFLISLYFCPTSFNNQCFYFQKDYSYFTLLMSQLNSVWFKFFCENWIMKSSTSFSNMIMRFVLTTYEYLYVSEKDRLNIILYCNSRNMSRKLTWLSLLSVARQYVVDVSAFQTSWICSPWFFKHIDFFLFVVSALREELTLLKSSTQSGQ